MAPTNNWKYGRAYKAMRALGYSTEAVKPILRDLLNAYEKNWDLIEENNYAVLVERLLDNEEQMKEDKELTSWLEDDEPEDNECSLKQSRRTSGSSHSSPAPKYGSSKQSETTAELLYTQKDHHNRTYTNQGNPQRTSEVRATSSPEPASNTEKLECIQVLYDDEDNQIDIVSSQKPSLVTTEGTSPQSLTTSKTRLSYESNPALVLECPNVVCSPDVSSDANAPDKFNSATMVPIYEPFSDDHPGTELQLVFQDLQTFKVTPNNNWKYGRAYKAMKALGYSKETVKPILRELLAACEKNWDPIEDNNYAPLVEAILDGEDHMKKDKELTSRLEDESEENERPLKRSRRTSGSSHSSLAHKYAGSKQTETTAGLLYTQKDHHNRNYTTQGNDELPLQVLPPQRMSEVRATISPEHASNKENDQMDSVSLQPCLISTEGKSSPSLIMTKSRLSYESNPAPGLENPNVGRSYDVLSDANAPDTFNSAATVPVYEPFSDDHPGEFLYSETSNAEETCLALSESVLLGTEEKDGSSNGLGVHYLEFPDSEDLYREGEQNGPSDSSQLDIASSLNGEVKISLIYKPSSQSDFCAPSLDSVVQRVEEEWIKSYGITQPGFSLLKLIEDVCEYFLAAGTASNGETSSLHTQSTAILPAKHNQEADHQPMFCIASEYFNGTVIFQNLIKVQPQIPMIPRSNMLETICIARNINCKRSQDVEERSKRKSLEILGSSTTSGGSMVVWEQQSSRKPFYYVEDITKGEEELKISLVNEFSNDSPPAFTYTSSNIVFQDARIEFLLARISGENCCSCCAGDCLSLKIPCACAGKTCGEFAYTTECLVKENFLESCISMNNGHLVRNFIKECWHKCGCSKKCGNRVVQRGIAVKLQVFMTPDGKGWGVRTLEDLPKGAFVCEYVGEILTNTELFERNMHSANEKHTYPVLLDADRSSERVLEDAEALCLDATHYGNVARFINHRCFDANLVEIPVEIETPDHHYYHLAFFTTRNINALEELTWDYGIDFDDHSHPVKAFKCHCGSKLCRDMKPKKRGRSRS